MNYQILKIAILLITLLYSVNTFCANIVVDLNDNEINYLNSKSQITVLVSSNNFPYEYLNRRNESAGIHIDYIKKILSLTYHDNVVFITDISNEVKPDIISSFSKHEQLRFKTNFLNTYEIYFLQQADQNEVDIDRYIVLNKEYLYDFYYEKLPNKKFFFTDDLISSVNLLSSERNSVLIFDCFNYRTLLTVNSLMSNHVAIIQKDNNINFFLSSDDAHLYNILNKCIRSLNEKNALLEIYNSYLSKSKSSLLYRNYYTVIISVFWGIIILLILSMIMMYIFKVYSFRLENAVNSYKKRNTELKSEMDKLIVQIETFKVDNNNFLGNINSFAFIMDIQGNIMFINQYCKTLLGYEPENMIGHNIEEYVSLEHKQKLLSLAMSKDKAENRKNSGNENETYNVNEIDINSLEGPKKTFIFSTHFNFISEKFTQIFCILHDISDRKHLKNQINAYTLYLEELVDQRFNALKKSEEQFKFVIDSAYDSIFMISNNVFTLVNEAFYTMTGWSDDKIKDEKTDFYDIIFPGDRERIQDSIKTNIDRQINHFILNTKILKFDGSLCDVEIHFSSIFSNEENRILGIIHDIAQKIEYENQKMQMEKLKAISSVAVMTNDQINSPLNAIQGYVELLENQINEPKPVQVKAFKTIYDSIFKIKDILQKLVSFTEDEKNINYTTEKYNYGDYDMLSLEKGKKNNE